MRSPEGKVEDAVDKLLTERGAWFQKKSAVQSWGRRGDLDRLVCYRGYFLGIELKREGVIKPTKLQYLTLQSVNRADGIAFVADNVTVVREALDSIDRHLEAIGHPVLL